MTITVFLVVKCVGEYSDKYEHIEHAWSVEAKAHSHIAELMEHQTKVVAATKLWESFSSEWIDQYPMPTHAALIPRPKWKQGLRREEITCAMRAERAEIEAANRAVLSKWGDVCRERDERCRHAVIAHLVDQLVDLDIIRQIDDNKWSYYEREATFVCRPCELD